VIVVSNTGPIIALAKIDHLWLFDGIGFSPHITPEVEAELKAKPSFELQRIELALQRTIRVRPVRWEALNVANEANLDHGEKSTILLAQESNADLILMDDEAGRLAATALGFKVMGFPGIVMLAKQKALIENAVPLIRQAKEHGYWISERLISKVQQLVNE
jgi:uncharacterized protein